MLTKQPDYTISELGYPQLHQLCDDGFHKKCRPQQAPSCSDRPRHSHSHWLRHSHSHNSSPSRLLPLRETLDDYNRRLLSEQNAKVANCVASQRRESVDVLAQQKRRKNLRNEQQQQRDKHNNNISRDNNQKCRDKAQGTTTMVTCDLNSF
ncbi:uncharacterized protein LOC6570124 isoform X2 [Drosophila grimshawi]|nr:uncharacterized protein LOC6570124 isoform X2 [Drosophila grimshawi]XP_032597745.1 uncharacterized protein LOC6570124 isoform X2 [Drosophila grimshawi]